MSIAPALNIKTHTEAIFPVTGSYSPLPVSSSRILGGALGASTGHSYPSHLSIPSAEGKHALAVTAKQLNEEQGQPQPRPRF